MLLCELCPSQLPGAGHSGQLSWRSLRCPAEESCTTNPRYELEWLKMYEESCFSCLFGRRDHQSPFFAGELVDRTKSNEATFVTETNGSLLKSSGDLRCFFFLRLLTSLAFSPFFFRFLFSFFFHCDFICCLEISCSLMRYTCLCGCSSVVLGTPIVFCHLYECHVCYFYNYHDGIAL